MILAQRLKFQVTPMDVARTVIACQVLGKVAQVSFERTVGTLAGGLLGLVTVLLGREMMQATDQAFTGTHPHILALYVVNGVRTQLC